MRESMQIIYHYLPALLRALPTTLELLGLSVLFALILGFFLAWGKISKNLPAKIISSVFISFMRGTPMMVQVLLIFILIPTIAYQHGMDTSSWSPFLYALIAYSLNLSAFFAEIYRSAYNGMDFRQIEAAESLGMTKIQVFRRVTMPQSAVIALPNLTNMTLEQMKNTSIAAVIGVYDIVARAQQLARNNYGSGQMQLYLTVGLIFWGLCLLILFVMNRVTKRLGRGMVLQKA
jgi:His/Glu/Gln/Arg/opine family amino acid ABC transporter permease subunit